MNDSSISDFSRRFSAALQGVMRENKVTVEAVSKRLGKSKGFVSTHTSGKAAPDTDLVDAVAYLAGQPTRALVIEIARRMRDGEGDEPSAAHPVTPIRPNLSVEEDNIEDLYEEPSAAEPERVDVEGDEEPEGP